MPLLEQSDVCLGACLHVQNDGSICLFFYNRAMMVEDAQATINDQKLRHLNISARMMSTEWWVINPHVMLQWNINNPLTSCSRDRRMLMKFCLFEATSLLVSLEEHRFARTTDRLQGMVKNNGDGGLQKQAIRLRTTCEAWSPQSPPGTTWPYSPISCYDSHMRVMTKIVLMPYNASWHVLSYFILLYLYSVTFCGEFSIVVVLVNRVFIYLIARGWRWAGSQGFSRRK